MPDPVVLSSDLAFSAITFTPGVVLNASQSSRDFFILFSIYIYIYV